MAHDKEDLRSQEFECHEDVIRMHTMAKQMGQLSENFAAFEVFKSELKEVLNKIIGGHNEVAQELLL